MSDNSYEYDVAISCLDQDKHLASRLYELLSPVLDVFLYTERQEELTGTDGLESFREPFTKSRINVVLHREGWGGERWTGVEELAIKERCYDGHWETLFVIKVDDSPPSKWLPPTHIYFSLVNYRIEGAAGAIMARVQEVGGKLQPDTAIKKAQRLNLRKEFEEQRETALNGPTAVNAAASEVAAIHREVTSLVDQIAVQSKKVQIESGSEDDKCIIRTEHASVGIYWYRQYSNSLSGSGLVIREFRGWVGMPGRGHDNLSARDREERAEHTYQFDLSQELGWSWRDDATGSFFTSTALANHALELLLDLQGRIDSGEAR
ncbi:MAG: hypothetical protein V3U86_10035 [Acidobacteriota bacterium]